MQHY